MVREGLPKQRAPRKGTLRALACAVLLCSGGAALGGCSLSGAVKGALSSNTPSKTYDLVLDRARITQYARLDTQLVVASPKAVKVLAGENILVKPSPNQVTYYGRAVWGDRLPKLFQARLIEAIQQSARFRSVSNGSDRINGDVTLASTLEAFQVEVTGDQAEAVIIIHAQLIHVSSGKVYASRRFTDRVSAANNQVDEAVLALNEGMNNVLAAMAKWVVKRGRLRLSSN